VAFAKVLGHERVKSLIARAVAGRRMPPALLLTGPEGVGKRTLALAAARGLLCRAFADGPCENCDPCARTGRALDGLAELRSRAEREEEPELFNHHLHPDLILVEPSPKTIKIEQVRAIVRELTGRPFEGGARVIVVDDADLMTEQGMNTLLKSLEEPPPGTHFVLVTAAPEALLRTIRSRCQLLRVGRLPEPLLEAHLRDVMGRSPQEARLLASLAAGSLGEALAFESDAYRSLRDELVALLEGRDGFERLTAAERLADLDEPQLALTALRSLLRDLVALRSGLAPEKLLNADVSPRLVALARGPLGSRAAALAETAGETREALRGNANALLSFDVLMDALAS
jgi:DNA polymerase-3 subunit delta'